MGENNGFPEYPRVKRIGHSDNKMLLQTGEIVVKEKLDGANFRFTWDPEQERIVYGTSKMEFWNEKDTSKGFYHVIEFVENRIDTDMLQSLNEQYGSIVVYGEAMHKHVLHYGEPVKVQHATVWEDVPDVVCFDVWGQTEGFLDWHEANIWCERLGLPTTNVTYEGPATQWDVPEEDEEFPDSVYRDGKPEGVVIQNTVTGDTAKLRTDAFKETKEQKDAPKGGPDHDSYDLAYRFTTEARVLKLIKEYEENQETIGMEIMETLWREVYQDIINEEYDTILTENHTIDTKELRTEVASITASILENYLSNPKRFEVYEQ